MLPIPDFPYHPDPFSSKVVVGADNQCECCGEKRTLFYIGPFYSAKEIEKICLWCVSDGSAASKFDGLFVDDLNFEGVDISQKAVEHVTRRTPSYNAWQQEQWLSHCGDACAFDGFPTVEELKSASNQTIEEWARRNHSDRNDWERTIELHEAKVAGVYKFKCRGCELILFAHDFS